MPRHVVLKPRLPRHSRSRHPLPRHHLSAPRAAALYVCAIGVCGHAPAESGSGCTSTAAEEPFEIRTSNFEPHFANTSLQPHCSHSSCSGCRTFTDS